MLSIGLNIISLLILIISRYNNFSIPRARGYVILSIFLVTSTYMQQCTIVNVGYIHVLIYQSFLTCDAMFNFIYVLLNYYIYPSGMCGFSSFAKTFLAVCLYFSYDDRAWLIIGNFVMTTIMNIVLGIMAEEIV
jgi:uncharacterized membrane protein YobD (UPF0266 family)